MIEVACFVVIVIANHNGCLCIYRCVSSSLPVFKFTVSKLFKDIPFRWMVGMFLNFLF